MYLVSLVDAIDELLRRRVPEELDGCGIHSFCLHVLWGCSRHCSKAVVEDGKTNSRRPSREERGERNS